MGSMLKIFLGGKHIALCKEITSLQNSQKERRRYLLPVSLLLQQNSSFQQTLLFISLKKLVIFPTEWLDMSVITHHVTIHVPVLAVIILLFSLMFKKLDVKSS